MFNKKTILIILGIVIITSGIIVFKKQKMVPENININKEQSTASESPTKPKSGGTQSDTIKTMPKFVVVVYNKEGFSPSVVNLNVGDSVRWVNQSTEDMWVASTMHTDHKDYDGTTIKDHCPNTLGFAFDQCQSVPQAGIYEFTFTKAGNWKYHNHENASFLGSVLVRAN